MSKWLFLGSHNKFQLLFISGNAISTDEQKQNTSDAAQCGIPKNSFSFLLNFRTQQRISNEKKKMKMRQRLFNKFTICILDFWWFWHSTWILKQTSRTHSHTFANYSSFTFLWFLQFASLFQLTLNCDIQLYVVWNRCCFFSVLSALLPASLSLSLTHTMCLPFSLF